MELVRKAAPWVAVILALPIALLGLDASAPTACSQLPGAFRGGVTTEQSDTLGVVASHCATTRASDGLVIEKNIVNWSGIVAVSAFLVGAWLLVAVAAGQVSKRTGGVGIGLCTIPIIGALVVFFV